MTNYRFLSTNLNIFLNLYDGWKMITCLAIKFIFVKTIHSLLKLEFCFKIVLMKIIVDDYNFIIIFVS